MIGAAMRTAPHTPPQPRVRADSWMTTAMAAPVSAKLVHAQGGRAWADVEVVVHAVAVWSDEAEQLAAAGASPASGGGGGEN